jgi:N-acylethanolamine-hydrolysing acid amidase
MILENLEHTLSSDYTPLWNLIQNLLLEENIDFHQAVRRFESERVTSPGYIIVGGLRDNEGVVIARDSNGTNHTHWLSDSEWYVAQTNRDVWRDFSDARYNSTVSYLDRLGQSGVTLDGKMIIENVLWYPGVLQLSTIFTATATANKSQKLTIYNPPNDT